MWMAVAVTPLVTEKLRNSESGRTARESSGPMLPAQASMTGTPSLYTQTWTPICRPSATCCSIRAWMAELAAESARDCSRSMVVMSAPPGQLFREWWARLLHFEGQLAEVAKVRRDRVAGRDIERVDIGATDDAVARKELFAVVAKDVRNVKCYLGQVLRVTPGVASPVWLSVQRNLRQAPSE